MKDQKETTMQPLVAAGIAGVVGLVVGFGVAQLPQLKGTPTGAQGALGAVQQRNRYDGTGSGRFRNTGGMMGNGTGAGAGQNGMMNRGVVGEITTKDDKSFTVKLPDGSSKIVFFSEKTTYQMMSAAKSDDAAQGKSVRVMGTTNTDGSITAENVWINPPAPQRLGQ